MTLTERQLVSWELVASMHSGPSALNNLCHKRRPAVAVVASLMWSLLLLLLLQLMLLWLLLLSLLFSAVAAVVVGISLLLLLLLLLLLHQCRGCFCCPLLRFRRSCHLLLSVIVQILVAADKDTRTPRCGLRGGGSWQVGCHCSFLQGLFSFLRRP